MIDKTVCKVCSTTANLIGEKKGIDKNQAFYIFQCPNCFFSFVENPITDYANIYSEDYYTGKGADPSVDYIYELNHFNSTIRLYEWRGILKIINSLVTITENTHWLDFGCGNGGLIRFCRTNSPANILGFEEGWIKDNAMHGDVQILNKNELEPLRHTFDIITAIEVLEHVEDPHQVLKTIHSLLKPGGLFFYTTGNAQPFRSNLLKWGYLAPEVHISLYEPKTLEFALQTAGFTPEYKNLFSAGFDDIIRYKILKKFHIRDQHWNEKLLPWSAITRIVDKIHHITAHPIAWSNSHI